MNKYKSGDILLEKWKLIKRIGEGGNSVVFTTKNIKNSEKEYLALKIINIKYLKKEDKKYKRFSGEIKIQSKFTKDNTPGILPLTDFNLPENPSKNNPILLFMPIAETSVTFFKKKYDFEGIVRCIYDISIILRSLIKKDSKFLHRDIKPSNIFLYNSEWCLGDFGLSDFEDKKDITKKDEKIGSAYFMSQEIIGKKDKFSEKSEVYALAKSLYCLLVECKYPIPGPHDVSDFYTTVSTYHIHPKVSQIDTLIECATKNNPDERMELNKFIEELDSWLNYKSRNKEDINDNNINESIKLIKAKNEPNSRIIKERDIKLSELEKINKETFNKISKINFGFNKEDTLFWIGLQNSIPDYYTDKNGLQWSIGFGQPFGSCIIYGCNTNKMIKGGFGFINLENKDIIIIVAIFFEEEGKGYSNEWIKYKKVTINSSFQEKTIDQFIESFQTEFPKKLEEFSNWI